MHTLVYIRRSQSFNNAVIHYAKEEIPSTRITTVSEYFNGDLRIDMNDKSNDYCWRAQQYLIDELNLPEIIFRDRLLRNTTHRDALVLVRRAVASVLNLLDNHVFDSLVTYPVDNYIMDILVQIAKKKNIPCYGVCNFFIGDYKRQTVFGEHNPHREVDSLEAGRVLDSLQNGFRSHMAPSRGKAFKAALVRYIRYKIRYPLFYLVGCKLFKRNEYDLMVTPHITTVRNAVNFFVERHFKPVSKIDFDKKSILVPLHYFPEATVEYWSGKLSQVEFEDMLLCEINQLSDRYEQIILKEHPAAVYDNPSAFYKRLLLNPKVVLVDPFVSTSELLEVVDVLGCWTGTAGIEALVNGKKVELFTNESYYRKALDLHAEAVEVHGKAIALKDPLIFVKEILKGCMPVEK